MSKAAYNPNAVRRCVRVSDVVNEVVVFTTKSFTSEDHEDKYHPMVNVQDGSCCCDCPDWTYRKAKRQPTVHSPEDALCKHLRRAVSNLRRKGFAL